MPWVTIQDIFITVVINDEGILQKAKEIEVMFNDGSTVRNKIDGKGTIIFCNNNNQEVKVQIKLTIYDKDMKKLYED